MHYTTRRFWECYNALPETVKLSADRCYELLKADPTHPSLHFKKVGKYWSVRAGQDYRALRIGIEQGILWFWIGAHADYDRLIG
ncbi:MULTISPECIES: hypothetical protein [unclassified Microcoleus]|uniref:hypothetical protein n=1 Tax=unclassified Microcoleus TaxID=2642155 RepID=UPI002FCEBE6E